MNGQLAVRKVDFDIAGMTCAACAARIEKVVGKMDGVEQVSVNLALNRATMAIVPAKIAIDQIERKIEWLGFTVHNRSEALHGAKSRSDLDLFDIRRSGIVVLLCLICMLPFIWAMAHHHAWASSIRVPELIVNPWFQWGLATIVQFVFGLPFHIRAYHALKNGSANMDVLVVIGTSAAYFYSHYLLFHSGVSGGHTGHTAASSHYDALYFDASVMIITIIWLGKWLEALARKRTLDSLGRLNKLRPETAHVLRSGKEWRISTAEVVPGDLLIVRPGEQIPADGYIVEGQAAIDESMISGESEPADKQPGDRVFSGTINRNGVLRVRVAVSDGGTMLSRMIRLVEEAQSSKAPIQRLADTISGVFVPVLIVLAAMTFVVWYWVITPGEAGGALEKAIAVLLIACPCALGLATPTSILVGSGRAAQSGILFKEGKYLEIVPQADVVVLDKTGTVTLGVPQLTGILSLAMPQSELLGMLAAAERNSEHPLARSIVDAAASQGLAVPACDSFIAVPGCGIRASVEGKGVLAGNRKWLQEQGVTGIVDFSRVERWEREGCTVVYAAVDGVFAGAVALSDTLKPGTRKAVEQLTSLGATVIMATGDHRSTAEAVARQAGITRVFPELPPDAKAALIRRLQEQGSKVIMVGDGVNDAPALAAADIGVAIARGTDIAKSAADVILLKNDINGLVRVIEISRKTIRIIRQNLGFSLLYNGLAIPFAAAGYLAPWMACTAMAFSSVTVLCNALRLRKA